MRMNELRKKNNQAVLEEEKRANDPNYEKTERALNWKARQEQQNEDLAAKGLTTEKLYLTQSSLHSEHVDGSKKTKTETFGWDVFNQDALFKAYNKRCETLPHYKEVYEQQKNNPDFARAENAERLQHLVEDLEKQEERRKKFSRRRTFQQEEDVNYINERNRVFNKKLDRHFGTFASEIKTNLERGSAI